MSNTLDELTSSVEALAHVVSTLGACDCDESWPCEQHAETVAQYNGSASRAADELISMVWDELIALRCADMDAQRHVEHDAHIIQCAGCVLDNADDYKVWSDYSAALSALDPFTSWLDDRDLVEAARDLCDSLESELPEDYRSEWDDGWTLVRITGGPLLTDDIASDWINEQLEAYARARITPAGRYVNGVSLPGIYVQSVTVVTATGGPHVEVTFELRPSGALAKCEGWWGGDHVVRHVTASGPLASWVESYVEACEVTS